MQKVNKERGSQVWFTLPKQAHRYVIKLSNTVKGIMDHYVYFNEVLWGDFMGFLHMCEFWHQEKVVKQSFTDRG